MPRCGAESRPRQTIVPERRVALARSLDLGGPLPADSIEPEEGELLALLIEHHLVEDDAATFSHFRAAG